MNKTDPTSSPPTHIKLASFVHCDKCGHDFRAMEKCGMGATGTKNSIVAMKHFTEYLLWCAQIIVHNTTLEHIRELSELNSEMTCQPQAYFNKKSTAGRNGSRERIQATALIPVQRQ